jgi:hypothetical protein
LTFGYTLLKNLPSEARSQVDQTVIAPEMSFLGSSGIGGNADSCEAEADADADGEDEADADGEAPWEADGEALTDAEGEADGELSLLPDPLLQPLSTSTSAKMPTRVIMNDFFIDPTPSQKIDFFLTSTDLSKPPRR